MASPSRCGPLLKQEFCADSHTTPSTDPTIDSLSLEVHPLQTQLIIPQPPNAAQPTVWLAESFFSKPR